MFMQGLPLRSRARPSSPGAQMAAEVGALEQVVGTALARLKLNSGL